MSLFNAFGKLLRPVSSPDQAEILCPRCEQRLDHRHDAKACESKGMTRRFMFGLLGASSAALAMRIEGVPLPTAQHLVIAYPGDRIRVKAKGVFSVAWDRPRPDKDAKRWNEDGMLIPASAIETFAPNEAERIYVDRGLAEMRIVSVIDDNTHQPPSLEFPINDGDILTVEGWKRPDGSLVQFRAVLPEGRALRVEPLQPGDTFSMDIRPRINPQE